MAVSGDRVPACEADGRRIRHERQLINSCVIADGRGPVLKTKSEIDDESFEVTDRRRKPRKAFTSGLIADESYILSIMILQTSQV